MKRLRLINTVALAVMLIVNLLANVLPIGGNTTAQVSEAYPNLFTPAPYTFAIWGVIYLMMVGFILYQWGLFDRGAYSDTVRERAGIWFTVSCAMNVGWVFAWHFRAIFLSLIFICGLLLSLVILYKRIRGADGSGLKKFFGDTGFALYLGWIIAATIANVSALLVSLSWGGWGLSSSLWTVIVILAATAIGLIAVLWDKSPMTGLAIAWALGGILVKHLSSAGHNGAYPFVIAASIIGMVLILCGIVMNIMHCKTKCEAETFE